MKNPLFLLLLLPYWCFSQDYLKLQNGDIFNCKIISVSDSLVVFKRNGIIKKIPESSVTKIMYNAHVYNEHQIATQDTSSHYNFTKPLPSAIPPPPPNYSSDAKTTNLFALTFLVVAVGSGLYTAFLEEPSPFGYSSLDYLLAMEEYKAKKRAGNSVMVISAGASIAFLIASNYYTLKLAETNKKVITLKQQGLGVGLCYTFK